MSLVCIEYKPGASYPRGRFNPDELYPEYPFGKEEVSDEKNNIYAMVRACFLDMGLDVEHYGSPDWNPLGEMIAPGDFVLIKPNLVMHENENRSINKDALACLVTHSACIRAVCDYCVLALKGTGQLVIGDAPMQGCDYDLLRQRSGLDNVAEFYREKGVKLEIRDFRQYRSKFNRNKVIVEKVDNESQTGITVHLGAQSAHYGADSNGQYQVSDYDKADTMRMHHGEVHDYEIAKDVLQADVIINFCKPKTHRLAGFTGAMKNMVGITYNKASLPHRAAGSLEEKGDAYLHKNWMKRTADAALTGKIRAEEKKHFSTATVLRYVYGAFLILARTFGKDPFYIGSWYGNDTIWRTICDLNYIVYYSDHEGILQPEPQRKVLNLADMVIAGEHNGPVSPQPKYLGCLMGSVDAVALDTVLCKLMGFSEEKIPLIRNICEGKTVFHYEEPEVLVHGPELERASLSKIEFDCGWKFVPHDAWTECEEDRKIKS